ncbi:hypothetical protein K1W54_42900, partial [Micromonospora sp. CPCC 205371]|nr:hypothetical protein [Micromonospora sp. CPCC 205371]
MTQDHELARLQAAPAPGGRTVGAERRSVDRRGAIAERWARRAARLQNQAKQAEARARRFATRAERQAAAADKLDGTNPARARRQRSAAEATAAEATAARARAERLLRAAEVAEQRRAEWLAGRERALGRMMRGVVRHLAGPTQAPPPLATVSEMLAIEEATGGAYQTPVAGWARAGYAGRVAAVMSAVGSVAEAVRAGGKGAYASLLLHWPVGTVTNVWVVNEGDGVRYVARSRRPASSLGELLWDGAETAVRHVEALVVNGRGEPVPIPGAPPGVPEGDRPAGGAAREGVTRRALGRAVEWTRAWKERRRARPSAVRRQWTVRKPFNASRTSGFETGPRPDRDGTVEAIQAAGPQLSGQLLDKYASIVFVPAVAGTAGPEAGGRDRGVQAGELIIRPIGGRGGGPGARGAGVVSGLGGGF